MQLHLPPSLCNFNSIANDSSSEVRSQVNKPNGLQA